jgi:ATP synthase protein I
MPNRNAATEARQSAFRFIAAQVCVLAVVVILAWLGWNGFVARSASLGGLASVLPSAYFAWRIFSRVDARMMKQMVRSFFINELVKLLLSVILVITFIKCFVVSMPAFFAGFVLTQLGFWVSPWFESKQLKRA